MTPLSPPAKGVLLAALALRLAAAAHSLAVPLSSGGDDRQYAEIAANLADGKGYALRGAPTAYRAPLYPLFLASLRKLGLGAPGSVRLVQAFVGTATVWLALQLGGLAAMALTAFDPAQVLLTTSLYTECVFGALVLLVAWALASWLERRDESSAARLGLACGLAALCRSSLLLVPFAALLYARARGRQVAVLLSAALVPLSPWIARNVATFGRPIVVESGVVGPIVFYASEGRVRAPADEASEEPMRSMYRSMPPLDWDRYSLSLARANIAAHPLRYVGGLGRRARALWADPYLPYLIHDHPAHAEAAERWWEPLSWACRLAFVAVCALAVGARKTSPAARAALLVLACANAHALGAVFARYHAPFLPLLYVVAGAGL